MNKQENNPHAAILSLMPWYVNGTLTDAEGAAFDAHLAICDHCAAACEQERTLARAVASETAAVPDAAIALAELEAGHDFERARGWLPRLRSQWATQAPLMRGLALAQTAAIAVLAIMIIVIMNTASPLASYRTVSDTPSTSSASFAVVFDPQTPQAAITALLEQHHVQIIAGPNAGGAYTLAVEENAVAVHHRIKASPVVEFAGALTPAGE